ncbi:MAG TPA: acyltransferase [Chitinophagaceae bacterium]|nr:acyltransferase [Chitinophagaceae bacterium]
MTDLHQPNTVPNKLYGLDHLRALAITIVFLYHYRQFEHPGWIPKIGKFGWTGVDLFFVLSGYLIASQLFARINKGKPVGLKTFFLKRVFRIIPAYLVAVSLYFCIPAFREKEALPPLWKFLTFTQNFGLDVQQQGTFSHAWSLCIEEQFYLVLPFLLVLLVSFKALPKGFFILIGLFLAGFIIRIYNWHYLVAPQTEPAAFSMAWYRYIYYPTYSRLDGLLAGVSIAAIFAFLPSLRAIFLKHGYLFLVSSLVVLGIGYFLTTDTQTFRHTVFGFPTVSIGYGLLVISSLSPITFLYQIRSRITEKIAALSYAIYLTHKGIIHLTQEYGTQLGLAPNGTVMFFLCAATAFLAALLLNIVIEKPFLKLRDRVLQSRQPQSKSLLEAAHY